MNQRDSQMEELIDDENDCDKKNAPGAEGAFFAESPSVEGELNH
jgi:hypothetical protein